MSGSPGFVIFAEDSGAGADEALQHLVRRLARRIEPDAQTQPERMPVRAAAGRPREMWHALKFASPRNEAGRRELVRDLATRLKTGQFVVLHYDGDEPWPGQRPEKPAVESLLRDVLRLLQGSVLPPELLRLVPCYSLEAWLYLNRRAIERLDPGVPQRAETLLWLEEHRGERGGYDHLSKPKDRCPIGSRWNLELARDSWDAQVASQRSPSWAHTEDEWGANTALRGWLQTTNPWRT